MLAGVTTLGVVGTPGNVVLFGPDAFAVVVGKVGDVERSAVVAASQLSGGRVVAFGHNGYWNASALDQGDGWKLFENCVRWAAKSPRGKVRVATWKNADFASALGAHGISAESIDDLAKLEKAPRPDVLCFASFALDQDESARIARFASSGGGLLVADTGWGWAQLNPGKTLRADHAGNRLLAPAGLAFGTGTPDRTSEAGFATNEAVSRYVEAFQALDALSAKPPPLGFGPNDAQQAAWSVSAALEVAPESEKTLRARVAKLASGRAPIVPTKSSPLAPERAIERVLLTLELDGIERAPLDKNRAHPAAAEFPGLVPKDAPRVVRTVVLDSRVQGWLSTGVYAAPGEAIEVALQGSERGAGWSLQIGAHSDDLTGVDEAWRRVPRVTFRWRIEGESTHAASPFGGLVYLIPPPKPRAETIEATFRRVVDAPRFVLGVTKPADWRARVRHHPAPWAELATSKIVLTVPSESVREIDDPTELLTTWDRVLDADAELAGISPARARPERFVTDEQISAGYMHSGYPIMAHLDAAAFVTSVDRLRADGWGPFHELGHNHQDGAWTFDGTTEVTCNLFTLFAYERVFGKKPADDERFTASACEKRWREHAKKGAPFAEWKSDPFLALVMYVDVQREFGWEPIQAAIASYAKLEAWERPKDDEQKRDRWLIQLSRATKKDLGGFFAAWGVPTSDAARAQLADLEAWKPAWMKSGPTSAR